MRTPAWPLLLSAAVAAFPDPLTEESCLECQQNVSNLKLAREQCTASLALARQASGQEIAALRARRATAGEQLARAQRAAQALQRELLRLRGRQARAEEERREAAERLLAPPSPALPSAAGALVGAPASARQACDAAAWLRCNEQRESAAQVLVACYARLANEGTRLLAREQQYELSAQHSKQALEHAQAQKTLLADAIDQIKHDLDSVKAQVEAMRSAAAVSQA
mmetsp:Transcript_104726/g.325453  ORF Transcript_104726/g.325453 Transcript_104726/m.325453 type:complete len:225 (-) Transcript_104726:207-881(-)